MLTIVGFILMKVSSCSQIDSAPKTKTTTPETSGMIGRLRVSIQETLSEIAVATMNRPVAMKIGPPRSPSAGNCSTSHSPRGLAKKKTSSGPSSSASLSSGFDAALLASDRPGLAFDGSVRHAFVIIFG